MLSTLFACGVIAGLSYLLLSDSNRQARAASSAQSTTSHQHASQPDADVLAEQAQGESGTEDSELAQASTEKLVQQGDKFLTTENFAAAAQRYIRAQQQTGVMNNELALRIAICAEYGRQYRAATEQYHRVIENQPTEVQRWIAQSGLSRCWLERGDRTEALAILSDLFIKSLNQPNLPKPLVAQVNYQLGRALQEVALQNYHYELGAPDGVAFHPVLPWLEELLLLIDPTNPEIAANMQAERLESLKKSFSGSADPERARDAVPQHPQVVVVQRPTESVELTAVDIQSPMVSLNQLVKHLAAACELDLYVSPAAKSLITAKSKAVNASSVPVSLILDNVLLPINVVWFQNERGLHLFSLLEDETLAPKFFPAATERTYRRFMVSFPGDYRVASALLARGNLKVLAGELDQAAVLYQELLQRNLKEELLAKVFFNLGKIELLLGRNESALRLFYSTADQTYDRELQAVAFWLMGQVSLEQRDISEAIRASGRSMALSKIDDQRRRAAMTLARAYLISNQPLSTNQVLFDHRQAFEGSSLERSAAVIGSLARYQGMSDKNNLSSEASRLLSALAMTRTEDFSHFLDLYIAARGWQELGFRDKAIELLTLAADATTIASWRRQFLFELGIQLTLTQQHDKAIAVFEFLITGEEDEWIEKAVVQLIQTYDRQGRHQDAINTGEKNLEKILNENNRQLVLQAMGTSYRELGQHHAAAVCFAGLFPRPKRPELH